MSPDKLIERRAKGLNRLKEQKAKLAEHFGVELPAHLQIKMHDTAHEQLRFIETLVEDLDVILASFEPKEESNESSTSQADVKVDAEAVSTTVEAGADVVQADNTETAAEPNVSAAVESDAKPVEEALAVDEPAKSATRKKKKPEAS